MQDKQEKKEVSLARFVIVALLCAVSLLITLLSFASLYLASQEYVVNYSMWVLLAFALGFWATEAALLWLERHKPVSKDKLHLQAHALANKVYGLRQRALALKSKPLEPLDMTLVQPRTWQAALAERDEWQEKLEFYAEFVSILEMFQDDPPPAA